MELILMILSLIMFVVAVVVAIRGKSDHEEEES